MNKEVGILLIEDNEGDIVLTIEAIKYANFTNEIEVVRDGQAALQYLRQEEDYSEALRPDLIMLDINLPQISGLDVLAQIKSDPNLMAIPVVVLTTSSSEKDVLESYQNYANCYITKPVDYQKFIDVVQSIKDFWSTIVTLPPRYR